MTRRMLSIAATFLLSLSPAIASAQDMTQSQIAHLTTIVAALEAEESSISSGQLLACAALFSKPSVHVGEPVVLAWGSVGAMNPGDDPKRSMWSQNGSSVVTLGQAGTWKYSFTFYSKVGGQVTCTTSIKVVPALVAQS